MASVAVGVDGSPCSFTALRWAAAEALSRSTGLRVIVVHAANADMPEIHTRALRTLDENPAPTTVFEPRSGNAAEVLLAVSAEVDTLVIGSRGLGPLRGALVGSITSQLAGHTRSPLVVVRDLSASPAGLIVVGVDGNSSAAALQFAFGHAQYSGATVRAVWSWNEGFTAAADPEFMLDAEWESSYEAGLTKILQPLREQYPSVPVTPVVTHGHPVRVLADQAQGADLLVVGSRGRGGFSSLVMGSVALGVLHHVPRPVAVVPSMMSPSRL